MEFLTVRVLEGDGDLVAMRDSVADCVSARPSRMAMANDGPRLQRLSRMAIIRV
jgi:hypothetical protein